jgi:hypothetical protein
MRVHLGWLAGLLLLSLACTRKGVVPAPAGEDPVSLSEADAYPEWALLALEVDRADGSWQVALRGFEKIRSAKHYETGEEQVPREGDLLLHFCDASDQVLWRHHLVQPLRQRYEYPGEDGAIHSAVVELDRQDLRLRLPWQPNLRRLRVFLVGDISDPPRQIAELPLDPGGY